MGSEARQILDDLAGPGDVSGAARLTDEPLHAAERQQHQIDLHAGDPPAPWTVSVAKLNRLAGPRRACDSADTITPGWVHPGVEAGLTQVQVATAGRDRAAARGAGTLGIATDHVGAVRGVKPPLCPSLQGNG